MEEVAGGMLSGWRRLAVLAVLGRAASAVAAASFSGSPTQISGATNPARIAVADMDHDGDLDVVYCLQNGNPSAVDILANTDSISNPGTNYGTGAAWIDYFPTTLSADCKGLAVADLDDNGWPDIVAARASEIKVCLNSTSKTRADAAATPTWTCSSYTSVNGMGVGGVAIGDMDHDGDLDIVFSGTTRGWLAQTSGGNFTDSVNQIAAPGNNARRVFVADIDNDGDNDVVVGDSSGTAHFNIYCSDGASSPTWTAQSVTVSTSDWMDGIGLADVDNDGRLDLVYTDIDGSAANRQIGWTKLTAGSSPNCVTIGANTQIENVDGPDPVVAEDLDGDNHPDAATITHQGTSTTGDNTIRWYLNVNSATSWTATSIGTYSAGATSNDADLVVGDMNGDGLKDMVGCSVSDDTIKWWAGSSTAGYPVPVLVAGPDHQNWMEACVRTWAVTSGNSGSYTQVRPHPSVSCGSSVSSIAAWDGFWALTNNAAVDVLLRPRPGVFTGSTSSQTATKTSLTSNNYYLLGSPLDPDSTAGSGKPNDVLGDDLGGTSAYETKWRSSHLINYSTGTRYYRWQGGSGTDTSYYWLPGRGFWLIHDGSVTTTIDVTGTELKQLVGTPPFDGARSIRLNAPNTSKNYYQLGNPFNYAFYWHDAAIRKPQETGSGISAVVNEAPLRHKRPKRNLPPWRVQLGIVETTSGGTLRDTDDCFFGMWGSALDGPDGNDLAKLAPPTTSFVRLFFPHDDPTDSETYWPDDTKKAANDFRELRRTRARWLLAVQTTAETGTYTLSWTADQPLLRRMPLVLTDIFDGTMVDMRAGSEYVFAAGPGTRRFQIAVDTHHARRPCPAKQRYRRSCRR